VGELKDYNIEIYNLSDTRHFYQFSFDNSFFRLFEGSLVKKGKGIVDVTLDKSPTFLNLNFKIKGVIELICDRSNDPFDYPLDIDCDIILKYGDDKVELSDTIAVIPWDTQRINVSQYIYEFVGLGIPLKKLHPRFKNDENGDEVIYSTESKSGKKKTNEIDPRWVELQKLKNNKEDDGAS